MIGASIKECLLVAAVVLAGALSLSAQAEPAAPDIARAKLAEGVSRLDAGDFAAALACFEEAYRAVPSPRILYNIGLALKGLGQYARAFQAFERFSREATGAHSEHRDYSQQQLERLSNRVAFVDVSSDVTEAELWLDGQSLGKLPIPARLPVDTGPHELMLRGPLGAISRQFTAVAGQVLELEVKLGGQLSRPSRPAPAGAPVTTGVRAESAQLEGVGEPFSLTIEAGLRLPRFHAGPADRSIDSSALAVASLRASYRVPLGRVSAELGIGTSFAHLPYENVQNGARVSSALVGASVTAGAGLRLGRKLRLRGDAQAGVVWWAGLAEGDPFTLDHAGATGPIPMPALGLGVTLEMALARSLFVSARISYDLISATSRGLRASISRLSVLDGKLGAGLRF